MSSGHPQAPRVAILILNYNGLEVTLKTLESMAQLDYEASDVYVIDNGCTDDSVPTIEERFPEVRQLHVSPNKGISWGLNHGIQHALENGYDYLLLCNNDIEVAPDMLTEMIKLAETDETIGCVGPKSFYYFDRDRLWSTGGRLRFRESITKERGDGELDHGQYDRDEEMDYINGCAMLVRGTAAADVGFWDPVYFLGIEDADYCVRLKRAGYRCMYAHRARLWHMISHSIGVYTPGRTFHTGRSSAIFVRKYARWFEKASVVIWLGGALPWAWLRELKRGNQAAATSKLKGFLQGLRTELSPIPGRYPLAEPPTVSVDPTKP